jgi:hypothetical protein
MSKSFSAIHEAFSNAFNDKKVPNKTRMQLVTTFLETGTVCL